MARRKRNQAEKKQSESKVFPSCWDADETCPLCGQPMDEPISGVSVEHWQGTFERIKAEHPEWDTEDGACTRCLAYYGMTRAGRKGEET